MMYDFISKSPKRANESIHLPSFNNNKQNPNPMKTPFKTIPLILLGILCTTLTMSAQSIEGRWDITITKGDKKIPSWLEVNHSGVKYLNGRFVGSGGSARPISRVNFKDNKMSFAIPPQWDKEDKDLVVEADLKDGKLVGTMNQPNGEVVNFVGVKAPKLINTTEPVFGKPMAIFNGKNLEGWEAIGRGDRDEKENQWVVENGVMKSPKSGTNIRTTKTFGDFKLHVEFRVPAGSNSGVYLRGRYEAQITDGFGIEPAVGELGGIYGFLKPLEMTAKKPSEWQSFDITLVGRIVTLLLNGKTIIYKDEIPGITGGAIDSNESEPGPIMFQGDHGPIEFRNITIALAK
jgi:hypothetical protein